MVLTPEHRAELEVLGPEIVRIRMMASDKVVVIPGFAIATTRSDIESWLTEKGIEDESDHRQWWWASLFFVVVSLATAVVLLSLGVKNRPLVIYSFSGITGWLAGAAAYFSWSVLYAHRRKKHRFITWMLFCVSVAALVGFVSWLHYTVRFDLAPPAAALIAPAPIVAPAAVTPVAPMIPVEPVAPAPVTPLAPVIPAEPVAPMPVTPVAPLRNPSFTCTRNGNVITCK
jgi:hypothetical protein